MALASISDEGMLTWECQGDECGMALSAYHLDERVHYRSHSGRARDGHPRAVIALPHCEECGAQMFLHTDYTRRDILRPNVLIPITNDVNAVQGFVMRLPHVRNLLLHHMLYQAGRIPHGPMLPLLPEAETAQAWLGSLSRDVAHAFWFPYTLMDVEAQVPFGEYLEHLNGQRPLPLPKEPPLVIAQVAS